jgi:hypothetical protein
MADPLKAAAHTSAATIDARIPARASAAHNTFFMSESPYVKQKRLGDANKRANGALIGYPLVIVISNS